MVSRSHRRMNPGISLNVFVGSPQLLRHFPNGPCLIIDADQQRLDQFRLQHPRERHPFAVELIQGVVASEKADGLTWHRFTDPRFNGPWPLSEWDELAPNLSEIDQCPLQPRPLASFLDQSGLLGDQALKIKLWLRQGNPIEILESSGPYLQRLDSILLRYPVLPPERQSALESVFSKAGLVLSEIDDNSWIRQHLSLDALHQPAFVNALRLLFDVSAYRQLRPDLSKWSDLELLQHWLNQFDFASLAESMRTIRQTMPREINQIADDDVVIQALSSVFPFDFYRSLRPDLKQFTDLELIRHYCNVGRNEGVEIAEGVSIHHVFEALTKVFPYAMYRQQCPDLVNLDDRSLIEHYCRAGLHQSVDLSEQVVVQQAQSFPASQHEQQHVRVKELEQLLAASTARISELQQALQASLSEGTDGR